MMHLAEAYNAAAQRLRAIADELAASPDNPEAVAKALRDTLAVLEQLAGIEPNAPLLAALHQKGTDLNIAGTITPDTIREIAHALAQIAQNYGDSAAQWNNIWT